MGLVQIAGYSPTDFNWRVISTCRGGVGPILIGDTCMWAACNAGGGHLKVCTGCTQLGERDEAVGPGQAIGSAEHDEDGADRVERVPAVQLAWGGRGAG